MKMQFGAIVVAGSGKIGGHVASRNKAGAYLRTKVTPVNPQTGYQLEVRERLAGLSQAWRDLTESQRQAWNAAVMDFSRTNVFGELKNPSGFNLYQRINNNLLTIGAASRTTPPQLQSPEANGTMDLAADVSANSVTLTFDTALDLTTRAKIFATAQLSPGKSFVKNEYRLIQILTDADASPLNIFAAYTAKFGALSVGKKIYVKMVRVQDTSGIEGLPIEASTIVVA